MGKIIYLSRNLIIAAIAFSLVKCGQGKAGQASQQKEETIAIRLRPVESTDYAPQLKYSGLVASTTEAKLSFKIGGIVSRVFVKEGDAVVKGQLLATLNLTEIDAQVQQSAKAMEKAQRDLGRVKNLYSDTVASLEQLQNAKTQVEIAGQGLRIAQFNRQFAEIHAPENGTIVKKLLQEGELASPGAPAFYFSGTANHDWVVRFGVPDKDWAILKKGDAATVHIDAYPNHSFNGTISEIAQGADPMSGTYQVEVKITPGQEKLAPGLFATIQLQPTGKEKLVLIPIESLAEANENSGFVYTLNADRRTVKRNAIRIAFLQKDKVAVFSGLDSIHEVIAEGAGYLSPNALVTVVK